MSWVKEAFDGARSRIKDAPQWLGGEELKKKDPSEIEKVIESRKQREEAIRQDCLEYVATLPLVDNEFTYVCPICYAEVGIGSSHGVITQGDAAKKMVHKPDCLWMRARWVYFNEA